MPKMTGLVHCVHPKMNPSETFSVKNLVLDCSQEINGQVYSNYIMLQASNKNIDKIDKATWAGVETGVSVGDEIEVEFALGSYSTFVGKKSGMEEAINNLSLTKLTIIKKNGFKKKEEESDLDD
jgi:hypothetical protein